MSQMPSQAQAATLPGLVLLCKRPSLGHAKQRLAASLGQQHALILAQALLDCALEDLRDWRGPRFIAPDAAAHLPWAESLGTEAHCVAQVEGNLGQRLNALDRRLREQGLRQLVFIGSDCPALRPDDYRQVRMLLQEHDTVLLDASDGGVVLMASNLPWPNLMALPWSTERLGEALAQRCRQAGQQVAIAGRSFDIDHASDLPLLQQALQDDPRPARHQLLAILNRPEIQVDA